jgi:hypothetical protein
MGFTSVVEIVAVRTSQNNTKPRRSISLLQEISHRKPAIRATLAARGL